MFVVVNMRYATSLRLFSNAVEAAKCTYECYTQEQKRNRSGHSFEHYYLKSPERVHMMYAEQDSFHSPRDIPPEEILSILKEAGHIP